MTDRRPRRPAAAHRFIAPLAGVLVATLLAACSAPTKTATPMLDTRNPDLRLSARLEAADLAWSSASGAPESREKAREIFKSLVWSDATPKPLRLKLAEHLLNDNSPEGLADSESFVVLRLPTERDRSLVGLMSLAAARNGWTDAAPSLVRKLADPVPGVEDAERIEALALQRLYPGKPIDRLVFDIFLGRTADAAEGSPIFDERVRTDAWAVLSRLDPDGATRRRLVLDRSSVATGAAATILADLRAAVGELGVTPSTAMELEWLSRLREAEETDDRRWWRRAAELTDNLSRDQRSGLALRHLEPIRIAADTDPALLRASRADLFAMLESRLDGRPRHRRTAELDGLQGRSPERPADWESELVWGDLLAILVIDDAVSTTEFARVMLQQAELDQRDRKTEYGGVVEAVNDAMGRAGDVRAVLFPPRPRDRVSDERFIASQDMIEYSDRALAHYHLQVQKDKNFKYAGPSSGDLRYAALSGRSCVVFTSLGRDRLGVDYYQPDGATIDLGEIRPAD